MTIRRTTDWRARAGAVVLSVLGASTLAAIGGAGPVGPALAATSSPVRPQAWADACDSRALGLGTVDVGLAPALPTNPDTNPDGTPVRISLDRRGTYTPVILVHGWVSRDTHTVDRDGTFSHLIDLTANRVVQVHTTRSLVGQLQRIPGTAVFTFDYRDYAARWVDDEHLGPALGKVIDCLYRASGQKVIVVGHSMGGLVARYAATHPGVTGSDRSGEISTVVTFGTPEIGSIAAALTDAAANGLAVGSEQLAILRLILASCGAISSGQVQTGTLCDTIPAPVRAFDSAAGQALRAGSPQLATLPAFPHEILVDALAGGASFVTNGGWFSLSHKASAVNVGDLIVTTGSATHDAPMTKQLSCSYQLDVRQGVADRIALAFGQVSKADVAQQPLASFGGACFHTNLMRSIELTNEATAAVADDVASRQPIIAQDLMSAPVPPACDHKGGTLVNGSLPGIPSAHGQTNLSLALQPDRTADLFATGDLNGDGRPDAAAVLDCNAGGVPWPDLVAFYGRAPHTAELRLLAAISLGDVNAPGFQPGENAGVRRISYLDGAVHAEWTTEQSGDAAAGGTLDYTATLRLSGPRMVASSLTPTTERPTIDKFLSLVKAGSLTSAGQLSASGVASTAADLLHAHPAARTAVLACHGYGVLDLPSKVADLAMSGGLPYASRLCLLPADTRSTQWIVFGLVHTDFRTWQVGWVNLV